MSEESSKCDKNDSISDTGRAVDNLRSTHCHNQKEEEEEDSISEAFLKIIDKLNKNLEGFNVPKKVEYVYNPTIYARHTFEMYVRKYCNTTKPIMFLGMNPGPWGMSQTGVPFGEIESVREWLDIEGPVEKPSRQNDARPVNGFKCTRTEVSGKRFWGLFKDLCGKPENFFKSSFVYNYLPQQWMTDSGSNLTLGDFKVKEVEDLYNICDPKLNEVLQLYKVEKIVAIGRFCETRAKKTLELSYLELSSQPRPIQILYMPHPSPRTVNNNNWREKAVEFLKNSSLLHYYQN